MKKILIPNGSFHDIPLIKKAKELGYYVITSGANPNGIGHKYADEYVFGDFSDSEKMLQIAQDKKIDRICSNCNDFGYLSACYVAEKMGIGGHETYENALILHQKDRFKDLSKKLKLSSPVAEGFSNIEKAEEYLDSVTFPIIVKPIDLGAGQGINRADNHEKAEWAIREAFEKSKCKRIVIEPFIEGTSHSFNAFIVNKKVRAYYSDNEYMLYSRYRVSTSGGPADYIEKAVDVLVSDSEKVAEALDLTDGLLHSQYILDEECHPHILEITRRMSGDWYPYPEMRATGVDWIDYIVKSQCGMDVTDFPINVKQKGFTGRHCLNSMRKGVVKNIKFKHELERYIYDLALWIDDGFEIRNLEKDYPGIIFFDFDDKEKMIYVIDNISDMVEHIYE